MTPEEILRKVGLNGKILKEFGLGKLLTNGNATHSTVILGDISRYLDKKKIPIDLIGEIQEALLFELKSMVPESQTFKGILRGSKQIGERVIDFQNAFNNLVKAHLRMPLSMDTVKKLEEGTNNLERLFNELKDIREPGMYGMKDSVNEFDDFQIGIFDSTFDSNTNLEDYVNTKVKNVTEYVDDFVMPEGIDTPTNVVGDINKIGTLDYPNQWHNTPTVKLVEAISENNLDIFVKNSKGEFVKLELDDTARIGENAIQNSPKFDEGKSAIYSAIEELGDVDNPRYKLDLYSSNPDELAKLENALSNVNFDPFVKPEGTSFQLLSDTPTNVVDERLRLERIIKNNIENPRLQEGLLTRYLDFDEFVKGLPTDRAEQLLDYTNKDIAFNLDLFKDEFSKQPPYDWPLSEDLETTFFDYVEPSPIEDARLADIEGWDLDADGNPIDPRNKPEGMSKWKQELSAQYDYLVTADTPTNVVPSTSSINEPDFIIKDSPIGPNTTKELKGLIDPELAAKAARVLQSSKEVGEAIVSSAQALAKNALKVGGKTLGVLDPGDVVISKSIPKLFASLGVTTLSSGALTVYAIYEGALLLADAVSGLQEANKKAGIGANRSEDFTGYSFTGGQTIDGRDVAYQQADFSSYGKDFWQGFTEDSVSDKYSLSYKLSKEIHNSLFGSVYGTIAETPKTPVGASGGGRVRIL